MTYQKKRVNYYPFGLKHKGYNNNPTSSNIALKYRQYQGQEFTEDLGLNTHEWKYRVSDPSIGRFWQIDPLAEDYVYNGTYNFSENRVVDAVELEGLEAFIIHGTDENRPRFRKNTLNEIQRIGGNVATNTSFRWDAPFKNSTNSRRRAASALVQHVTTTRNTMIEAGSISADEPITLVGYSHGGNVAIQALKEISEATGLKINLITVSTPATNDSNDPEDPINMLDTAINEHLHLIHENDGISMLLTTNSTYNNRSQNGKSTKNIVVRNEDVKIDGPIDAHVNFPNHPDLANFLKTIQSINNNQNKRE